LAANYVATVTSMLGAERYTLLLLVALSMA
jgi:hypothetical protein